MTHRYRTWDTYLVTNCPSRRNKETNHSLDRCEVVAMGLPQFTFVARLRGWFTRRVTP